MYKRQLPGLEGRPEPPEVVAALRGWGLEPLRIEALGEAKHIFTHVEWRMAGLRITVEERRETAGLVWALPEELREDYPLPSAFRAYLGPLLEG